MSKERESIFVIQFKDYNGLQPYVTASLLPTMDINNAELFATRTEAYKSMLASGLDKKCAIVEVK